MHIRSASNTNEVNWDDPLNKGLVSWYSFKQKGGNVLRDVVGNYDGTLDSSMTGDDWVASPETNSLALDFDGTNGRVDTGIDAVSWRQVTLSYWFWSEAGSQPDSYAETVWSQGNQVGFYQNRNSNELISRLKTENGTVNVSVGSNFNTGGWHHVAMTWDGQTVRTYKDATFNSDANLTGSILGPGEFTIGAGLYNYFKGKISDVRVYDRGLSANEVHDLYVASRTGYVNQYKRRYFPVSLQTEEPPVETATSGLIRLKSPKRSEPSYKSGYAQSAGESAHPNLWDGLVGAWMPSLGVTGGILRDVSENENHGTLTNMDPATDWVTTSKGLALDFDGVNHLVEVPDNESLSIATSDWTIVCLLKNLQGTTNTGKFEGIVQKGYFEANAGWEILRNGTHASGPIGCVAVAYGSQAQYGNTAMSSTDFSSIVWRKKGANSTLWLNGNLDDETTLGSKNEYSSPLVIGQRNLSAVSPGYFNGPISSVYIFDRGLSPNEIKQLYVDPLALFRKKQQVAFNAYPLTLLEKIRSVAKPTTTRAISVKKNSVPSYKSGYAKSASESANPNLWNGLVGAWAPRLGSTGTSLKDTSGVGYEGSIAVDGTSPLDTAWTSEGLNFTGRTFPDVRADLNTDRRSDTTGSVFASFKARTLQQGAVWWLGDNASSADYAALEIRAGGEQRFQVRTSAGYVFVRETTGSLLVSVDEWQTIAGTQDGTGTYGPRTYINGTETGNAVVSPIVELNADGWLSSGSSNVNDITLGYYGRTNPRAYFDGIIGVVLQYNRALSPSEIKYLHADPLAPFRKKTTVGYQPSKELRGLFRT